MMPMGGLELLILLVIILLFFGAKRVPEVARSLGKGKHEFRKGIKEEAEAEEHDKAEVRQDKEESPPPERTHPEEGSVPEEEKPKAKPSSKA